MLIFMHKSFSFCIPRLKTPQPVLPYCVKWLSAELCALYDWMVNNDTACAYWTWIPPTSGNTGTCYLKYANHGNTTLTGAFSGDYHCTGLNSTSTGNESEPYQHFFPLF